MEVEWRIAPFLPSIVPDCHTLRMRLMTVEDINCHRFAWLPWHGGSDWKAAGCLVGGLALYPNRYPFNFHNCSHCVQEWIPRNVHYRSTLKWESVAP